MIRNGSNLIEFNLMGDASCATDDMSPERVHRVSPSATHQAQVSVLFVYTPNIEKPDCKVSVIIVSPDSQSPESEPPVGSWKGGRGASRSWSRHCGRPGSSRSRWSGRRRLRFRPCLVKHLVELGVVLGWGWLLLLPL